MFQRIRDSCFGKKDKIDMVRPKDDLEVEDSYETVPMYDIEKRGNQIRFWPNNIPLWQKLLVIGFMGFAFHFQVVSILLKL